jgi:hypothetical protein
VNDDVLTTNACQGFEGVKRNCDNVKNFIERLKEQYNTLPQNQKRSMPEVIKEWIEGEVQTIKSVSRQVTRDFVPPR